MMSLIKNEFIKEYTLKRIIITICIFVALALSTYLYNAVIPVLTKELSGDIEESYFNVQSLYEKAKESYENEPNGKKLFYLKIMETSYDQASLVYKNDISYDDWRYEAISDANYYAIDEIVLEMLLAGYDISSFYSGESKYVSLTKEEQQLEYDRLKKWKEDLYAIASAGHYYEYATVMLSEKQIKFKELSETQPDDGYIQSIKKEISTYEYIIDHKIKSKDDFRLKELNHIYTLNTLNDFNVLSEDEFYKDTSLVQSYYNYDEYLEIVTNKKTYLNAEIKKNNYALDHEIKYITNNYKNSMIMVLYFSFIIGIFVIVRSGSSVSEEQHNGSLRLLLTQGISRSKILLAKLLNIIIDLYVHYFIFILIFIIVGLFFNQFGDLLVPNLDVIGNNVVQSNYFVYLLKMTFLCSIPLIFFAVLSLFLSVITLNSVLAIGASTFIMISGFLLLNWIKMLHIEFLQYTPLPYLDITKFLYLSSGTGYSNYDFLISTYNLDKGIIILVVWVIIFYVITNIVFGRRDVVNQ